MANLYTVWVGGVEVNDFYLDFEQAYAVARYHAKRGHDDVSVERVHLPEYKGLGFLGMAFFTSLFSGSLMTLLAGVYLARTSGEGAWMWLTAGLAGAVLVVALLISSPAVRYECGIGGDDE